MEVRKVVGERGKELFFISGYKFNFQKNLANDIKRWTCTDKKCKCFLKTDLNDEIIESHLDHTHPASNFKDIERQHISNTLKRKAVDNVCDRPLKILHQYLVSNNVETIDSRDLQKIRRNMSNARTRELPKLPEDFEELHAALSDYGKLIDGKEPFLLVNDTDKNILVFSTVSNLKYLMTCSTLFVDGTFKSSPSLFSQLFTIHGFKNTSYIPLVFSLLPDKKQETYEALFGHLTNEISKLGLVFSPETIFVDFEIGIHNAVRNSFTNCVIKGCRFHLAQAWWRYIQTLGLSLDYKKSDEHGRFLKLFFGLPFLTPNDVDDFFTEDLMSMVPDDEKVLKFCDYVLENFISSESKFPPEMWASYSPTTTRTTNACESFHARLNSLIPCPHPNIFKIIDILLGFQAETVCKMNQSDAMKRPYITIKKEKYIAQLMKKYSSKEISRMEFVMQVSMKFIPKKWY